MATTLTIRGIPVSFPFEPYPLQVDYMGKVIDCLQNESNGVLESPTGTGKTMALLCSSLAWLTMKKAQLQAQYQQSTLNEANEYMRSLKADLDSMAGTSNGSGKAFFSVPSIIYSSRTHSQLSQAMQELKRTAYSHMKATVLGSREQMCIHPDVIKETSASVKINMCRLKVQTRSCYFYNHVEKRKDDPAIRNLSIIDIEDIVKLGETKKFCPYYMAKELKQNSDMIFMPYNYLLDPRARKALGVELSNNIVILDEAHNIERICEDSASLQIKTTDIALCIDEVTEVMKTMSEESIGFMNNDMPKDFSADELCVLKDIFLNLEKALDEIELKSDPEGTTFEGSYIFQIFEKAGIRDDNVYLVMALLEKIVQFLSTAREGPFQRKGNGLQLFEDLLRIAYSSSTPTFKDKIKQCYKVHIAVEDQKQQKQKSVDGWFSKAIKSKRACRVLSYWCFSPGFGMNMLMEKGVKCVILTSGTLAPLLPLISELELKVDVRLENPHIVKPQQVCVKILCKGPDNEILNCSYQNRNNPKYVSSLGRSIVNLTRIIPDGLLIFFPSYPILKKCQDQWQEEGIWSNIQAVKPIFVEPKEKDAFNSAMADYYSKIQDPNVKGAIFMGVCRGKVSEGLDFADTNGRAVMVVGLPYPPLRDPRIILKKRYLDICNARNKDYLRGDDWYSLEASRAVNQAIGRVIRHKDDYGAVILLDSRFNNFKIKSQMSLWLRDRIEVVQNFGTIIRDIRGFFRTAETTLPQPTLRKLKQDDLQNVSIPAEFEVPRTYKQGVFEFTSDSSGSSSDISQGLVTIHKRGSSDTIQHMRKKQRIVLVSNTTGTCEQTDTNDKNKTTDAKEYIIMVKNALNPEDFQCFIKGLTAYRNISNFNEFVTCLDNIFLKQYSLRYIIQGLSPYIKESHKSDFETYWEKMR